MSILILWFCVGLFAAFLRFVEFDWFNDLSWAQVIIFSIVIGPAWLFVGVIWLLVLLSNKIRELWDLLGEIGKRN